MKIFTTTIAAILLIAFSQSSEAQQRKIISFVKEIYIEGVPYNQVKAFNPDSALPILLNMLSDQKNEQYWPNVVVTLGMLGDERAVEPLIEFLNEDMSGRRLSHAHYIAKSSVVMALGYIVNESRNQRALDFLIESANPDNWKQRNPNWASPYHPEKIDLYQQLSTMSVLGLGLSGHPDAAEKLETMQRVRTIPQRRAIDTTRPAVRVNPTMIKEALKANKMIQSEGLKAYSRKSG